MSDVRVSCRTVRVLLAFLIYIAVLSGFSTAQSKANANAPPLDLKQVTALAVSPGITLQRFSEIVGRRGLDFVVTDEINKELARQGAQQEKLKILKTARQPRPPAIIQTPPPAPGSLSIICAPLECDIKINGRPAGTTSGGRKIMKNLKPGAVTIDFSKSNPAYLSDQIETIIYPGEPTEIREELEPTIDTQKQFGTQVLQRMKAALLGGDSAEKNITADGQMTLFTSSGRTRTSFLVKLKLAPGQRMELEMRELSPAVRDQGKVQRRGSKGKKQGDSEQFKITNKIDDDLYRLIPTAVVREIERSHMEVLAYEPPEGSSGVIHFAASNPVQQFQLELSSETFLPFSISSKLPKVGAVSEMQCYEFTPVGKVKFPRHIVIPYDDKSGNGVEFRFNSVALGAKFKPIPKLP